MAKQKECLHTSVCRQPRSAHLQSHLWQDQTYRSLWGCAETKKEYSPIIMRKQQKNIRVEWDNILMIRDALSSTGSMKRQFIPRYVGKWAGGLRRSYALLPDKRSMMNIMVTFYPSSFYYPQAQTDMVKLWSDGSSTYSNGQHQIPDVRSQTIRNARNILPTWFTRKQWEWLDNRIPNGAFFGVFTTTLCLTQNAGATGDSILSSIKQNSIG